MASSENADVAMLSGCAAVSLVLSDGASTDAKWFGGESGMWDRICMPGQRWRDDIPRGRMSEVKYARDQRPRTVSEESPVGRTIV